MRINSYDIILWYDIVISYKMILYYTIQDNGYTCTRISVFNTCTLKLYILKSTISVF